MVALACLALVGTFSFFGFTQESVVLSEATAQYTEIRKDVIQGQTDQGAATAQQQSPSSQYTSIQRKPQKDKLSLEQWQQVQQSTIHYLQQVDSSSMECKPLQGGALTLVWAYDGPPDLQRFQDSIASVPEGTKIKVYCGSTACLERANRIRMSEHYACLELERLNVPHLAQETPLETWANHHVLVKLLAGHLYEDYLQVAMQLAAAWKYGGVVLQPGVKYEQANNDKEDLTVWTCPSQGGAVTTMGGLVGLMTASSQSEGVKTMIANFLNAFTWDKTIRDRYVPDKWPVQVNWKALVTPAPSSEAHCPSLDFVDGYPGPAKYFGTLNYDERHKYLVEYLHNHGMNLGDETQGLAGIQALPRLDAFVERDRVEMVRFTNVKTPPLVYNSSLPDDGRRVQVFFNAWWGTKTMTWPPPAYIDPISLSMHVQPRPEITSIFRELPESSVATEVVVEAASTAKSWVYRLYDKIFGSSSPEETVERPLAAPYLKSQAPIGARDTKTLQFLRDNGVQALFSACLTMTLSLPNVERDNSVLIVDVNATAQLKGRVPDHVLDGSTFYTQKLLGDDAEDNVLRFVLAFERLLAYSRARLVITNRLHVAMPCVALGTPVIFVHGKTLPGGGGNRMDGLDVFMHKMTDDKSMPEDFDWTNPPPNPRGDDFKKQVKRIQQLATCHSGISDPSRKFGVMPADWKAGEEDEVCTRETAWTANPKAIHIATSIDANFFELVFPSWLNALAKSNPDESLVLYILTVKLSEKQRCLLRLMVLKMLPNAKVFTIPTSVADFEGSYGARKRGHISVATQARLRLPSILPCVRKLLWIDLDAFVVGPIRKAWDEPTGTCGITARSSIVKYMYHNKKYYPSLRTWHDDYGKSFNAGVLIVDLQQLRESQFEEKIVQYWAADLGANDQVTFNLACNASHAELDPRINVFQGTSAENTPPRDEWIIAHFQSSKKPWSGWDSSWSSQDFWDIWEQTKLTFEEVLDL